MATITGLTAARMLEIEGESIVDGEVVAGNLILTKHDGTTIDAGSVIGPQGDAGPVGPSSVSSIPGEVKLWPSTVLPEEADYGLWVWANGAVYVTATYPLAAAHIAAAWRTFGGASDPGAGNFRVPDVRGLVPAGLDQMPGDVSRANRMTRAVAITIAAKTGEETHVILLSEMAAHGHGVTDGTHRHTNGDGGELLPRNPDHALGPTYTGSGFTDGSPQFYTGYSATGISINNAGGNGAHENVQPTVFVPYIVKLDD